MKRGNRDRARRIVWCVVGTVWCAVWKFDLFKCFNWSTCRQICSLRVVWRLLPVVSEGDLGDVTQGFIQIIRTEGFSSTTHLKSKVPALVPIFEVRHWEACGLWAWALWWDWSFMKFSDYNRALLSSYTRQDDFKSAPPHAPSARVRLH